MSNYYHCSPVQFEAGDTVVPGDKSKVMFMSDAPYPHKTIPHAYYWGWYVYQVKPKGQLWYGTDYHELMAEEAVVIQCLGKADNLFPDKKLSTVKLSNHPKAIPVSDCSYVGCESPLAYFLSMAFELYQDVEEGYQYPDYLNTALMLIEGKEDMISGDSKYYLEKFNPFAKPFFGPPG
jgi:hypothetical protein